MEIETYKSNLSLVKCIPLSKERSLETYNNPHTFCVFLKHVEGFRESANAESYRIQAVLFDQKYQRFLGSFWLGKPVITKNALCLINQVLYFYTSVPAKELSLVIEIIAESEIRKTCGWLYLPLVEVEDEVTYKLPFIKGSPFFLLLSEEINDTKDINFSDHTTGLEISFSLSPQPTLLKISHLLPENILIDPSTEIPGVLSQPETTDDDEYTYEPQLQKCITFVLERLCVRMQTPLNVFEKEVLQKVQAHLTAVKPDENLLKTRLLQRRLQVVVHNGYCFIQEPDFYNLLVETLATPTLNKTLRRASSLGSLNVGGEEGLVLRSDVKLPNIPDDPDMNIVFLLEYIVVLENSQEMQMTITSVTKNPTCHMIIAWGFCNLGTLLKNPSQNIDLSCDPTFAPHKIKFLRTEKELKLSFSAFSLLKQKKNSSISSPLEPHEQVISSPSKSDSSFVSSNAPFSKQVSKYKSVADIPMSVEQSTGKSLEKINSVYKNENNLTLQEVTLVQSSLPLIPPLLHSFPLAIGVSPGTFTKLYWDKLPSILDHHGKPAFFIDNTAMYKIDADVEMQCQPQRNECMLNFIAISCFDEYVEVPCEVFFTFQFYRFLPIKTEGLVLKQLSDNDDSAQRPSFVFTLHGKQDKGDQLPGFNVTYHLDPTELNPGEYKSFLHYLINHSLHIDLWNAQSFLYFGTVMLPLKYLCRQGKEAVTTVLELEIINCEFPDESLTQNSAPIRKPLGKLHVNLASKRHPISSKALENYEDKNLNLDSIIIYSNGTDPSDSPRHIISKARPIAETDKELSKLLSSKHMVNNLENMSPDPRVTEERRRKLARMENIRKLENANSCDGSKKSELNGMHSLLKEKQRDLLSIESYIQRNKSEIIHSLLCKSVTSEKLIFPVIGSKVYFEFVLQNPFPVAKKIEIVWKCSELHLVVDNKLWHVLRSLNNLSEKTNPLKFVDTESNKPSIMLQPGEKIHIPFTYQCFTASPCHLDLFKAVSGHNFTSDILSSTQARNIIQSSVKIRFMTEERTLLAVLNLKIQPLPPSFTHVFKFLSIENSMFKKSILISRDNSMGDIDLKISDSSVVCTIQKNESSDRNVKILVKAPTKSAGKYSEFYIFVYNDEFQIVPYQTWCVSLCAFQRIDLSCTAGQLMRSSLLIRGTHATNLVRCFSSSQDLLLDPNEAFILSPFAVQELSMNMRSLIPGIKHFQITMVDQSQEQVLQTWLLVLSCQKPSVSKAFQIHLSVGKEAAKRITYTNPYNQTRNLILYSTHPHLLSLRESEFTVLPGKSYSIGLYFLPQEYIFTETVFLYMNDTSDKNEETYCIKVVCQ